jgi:DNA/RNA-binding domain of Phe-tRNA-synthetase-like protein
MPGREAAESRVELFLERYPSLYLATFSTRFPKELRAVESPASLTALLDPSAEAPVARSEETRSAIRDLLRPFGYKPTGRGKPASEYLLRAAAEGGLTTINAAVDVCNAVSLHSGLPISVIDLDRADPPLRIAVAPAKTTYVFNAAGQEMDVGGLLCLQDRNGPCANAVKDSERTKTAPETRRTLTVIWGAEAVKPQVEAAERWYRRLLEELGASCETVARVVS